MNVMFSQKGSESYLTRSQSHGQPAKNRNSQNMMRCYYIKNLTAFYLKYVRKVTRILMSFWVSLHKTRQQEKTRPQTSSSASQRALRAPTCQNMRNVLDDSVATERAHARAHTHTHTHTTADMLVHEHTLALSAVPQSAERVEGWVRGGRSWQMC